MKKILVVRTGGTIGSVDNEGTITTAADSCRVLEMFLEKDNRESFEVITPYLILSENLRPSHWERLIRTVAQADRKVFKGIIILHGSDTLSYTSAMLGLCFRELRLPVVITASDLVPMNEKSNALCNFTEAVRIVNRGKTGVYTVFRNKPGDTDNVFLPWEITEADRFTDCFCRVKGADRPDITVSHPENICFRKTVRMVFSYPGMDPEDIAPGKDTGAVLLVSYHSGTAPDTAMKLLRNCKDRGIPLYICSFKKGQKIFYETTGSFIAKGAVPLYNITNETAYAALLIRLNVQGGNL